MNWLVTLAGLLPITLALYRNGSVTAPCDSPLYCQGDILKQIQLAGAFKDSKTYVDLPTIRPLNEVLAAFEKLTKPLSNDTALQSFLATYFGKAGSELKELDPASFKTDPTFLEKVNDTNIRDFIRQVIDIWPDLTRSYAGSGNCSECVSSFIPLNRSFVVAGGRFREAYYWDSFWIVEGLLRTKGSFTKIALNIIENFLDLVEEFGFVPNGARKYYLNRSQPPVLSLMVKAYIEYTNDTSIITRAIPLLEKEYSFWTNNRSVDITVNGTTYSLNHYAVENNQPRPESYVEDYRTVTNQSYYAASGVIYPAAPLNSSEMDLLYADLASGAESGWDYSSRWIADVNDAIDGVYFPLRSLDTINIIPIDLNSILYANEIIIAELYSTINPDAAASWAACAAKRSEAMTAVLWSEEHWSYFDYNLSSQALNMHIPADADANTTETRDAPAGMQVFEHIAQYYPYWTGAAPNYLKHNPSAILRAFEPIEKQLARFPGAPPATNIKTGQQWDEPNVWPPHIYVLISGLLNTTPTFGPDDPSYMQTQALALEIAQRYLDSTFCTWRTSGGATAELPKLKNLNPKEDFGGAIFEKYNSTDILTYGGGGEYDVQLGFGWSNGVLIWIGDLFGERLKLPQCEKALEGSLRIRNGRRGDE